MGFVRTFDHVGITVANLEKATDFFLALGLELEGTTTVEGEFVDTVCGIPGSRCRIAMLRAPGGGSAIELSTFVHPPVQPGLPNAPATTLGIRNVSFEVSGLDGAVAMAAAAGYGLVGGVGEYEGSWRMAYLKGPEGITVSLAERVGTPAELGS